MPVLKCDVYKIYCFWQQQYSKTPSSSCLHDMLYTGCKMKDIIKFLNLDKYFIPSDFFFTIHTFQIKANFVHFLRTTVMIR